MDDFSVDGGRGMVSANYRGYRIAAAREQSRWRVAVDGVELSGVSFDNQQEATAWLRRRIDDRIAEALFPGLARAGD